MGYQDRDYYRERWAKREGFTERSPMRMSLGKSSVLSPPPPPSPPTNFPFRSRPSRSSSGWHWSLSVLATVFICLLVWFLLRAVVRFR